MSRTNRYEYTYDKLNRVVTGDVAKVKTNYTYDTLGNLVLEKSKNKDMAIKSDAGIGESKMGLAI